MHEVKHISIYIHRAPSVVYEFASNPKKLALMAANLYSRLYANWVCQISSLLMMHKLLLKTCKH